MCTQGKGLKMSAGEPSRTRQDLLGKRLKAWEWGYRDGEEGEEEEEGYKYFREIQFCDLRGDLAPLQLPVHTPC